MEAQNSWAKMEAVWRKMYRLTGSVATSFMIFKMISTGNRQMRASEFCLLLTSKARTSLSSVAVSAASLVVVVVPGRGRGITAADREVDATGGMVDATDREVDEAGREVDETDRGVGAIGGEAVADGEPPVPTGEVPMVPEGKTGGPSG